MDLMLKIVRYTLSCLIEVSCGIFKHSCFLKTWFCVIAHWNYTKKYCSWQKIKIQKDIVMVVLRESVCVGKVNYNFHELILIVEKIQETH